MEHTNKSHYKSSKLNVLLLPLEFTTWKRASHWTYAEQLGLEEGFTYNNVDFFTIPVFEEFPSSSLASWLYYTRQLCSGKKFDQVWIWLSHPQYDEAFWQWVKDIAPIRVGFLMESMEYSTQEFEDNPGLYGVYIKRKKALATQMHYMTHILACDEADAEKINKQGVCKALWYPSAVPERFLATSAVVRHNEAVFCGDLYGNRYKWLEDYGLKGLMVSKVSDENATEYPRLFDELNSKVANFLKQNRIADEPFLMNYLNILRQIRQACFKLWLNGLQTGCAIVNLPHLFKAYAGRVVEAMSVGRPVISWEIPNRPRNRSLFEDGKEILLFDESKPEQLANHIRRLQNDTDFACRIADNALQKVRKFHTVEKRIQQVLEWIETGAEPDFGETKEIAELSDDNQQALLIKTEPSEIKGQKHEQKRLVDHKFTDVIRKSATEFNHLSTAKSYFIKSGYQCNLDSNGNINLYYDDIQPSSFYQAAVYRFAAEVIKENRLTNVLDIGCGHGVKLKKYINRVCQDITGIDFEHSISFCKKVYNFGKWFIDNIEKPNLRLDRKFDLIISSDVIEHLVNPDTLFEYIKSYCHKETIIILSTPERDMTRGKNSFGPPSNKAHIREWNMEEFHQYLCSRGFDILKSFLVKAKDDEVTEDCQVFLCKLAIEQIEARGQTIQTNSGSNDVQLYFKQTTDLPNKKLTSIVKTITRYDNQLNANIKPQFSVLMANYNNAKYIAEAIESVLRQTFRDWELIIVDDCSTDNSQEIITQYLNDKRIRFIQHEQNRGYAATLKSAIANVRSEYFGILDSDDCLTSSAVETMYLYHVRFPDCGLIYSQFIRCHEDLTPKQIGFGDEMPPGKTDIEKHVVTAFRTFKIRDYLKTAGYDEDILYAEDRDICYKMEEVTRLKFVDQCLYLYRELPNSQCHDPTKASIGRQSCEKAKLNAIRRRGLMPAAGQVQKSDPLAPEQSIIWSRYILGSSYLKAGRHIKAQITLESILAPLTRLLKGGRAQLPAQELDGYNNAAECHLSVCTKLAQCYQKQQQYDKVKQIYTHLLNNQYLDLPEKQKASIHSVLAKLESIKLPAISSMADSPRNPFRGQEEPLISVYLVTYNMEKFIHQAIDSVLAQTYQNLELLIVDDGSTDATKDIVASYSDDRVRYIYKPHKNFASGMNMAISEAKGEYLTGVDSDDFIATDYIEKLLICARKHPEIDYFYPAKLALVDKSGDSTGAKWNYLDFSDNRLLPAFLFSNGHSPIPNSPSLKRKSLFDKVGLYEELDTVEDFVFLCKNALRINFKRVEEHSMYFYRRLQSGNSYKLMARNRIMAQALNDMVSIYPPELLCPKIADISDEILRKQKFFEYLATTFYKHANGPMVQFGDYFRQYADYYKQKVSEMLPSKYETGILGKL
jgi:glycosyltransferase involved in cell wall biosynthesis/2-polyprenyl-3-methyl-5-hydroxy-6-metoxy-1,4-benzoquinol methylase